MRACVRLKLTRSIGEVVVAEGRAAWANVAAIGQRQITYLVAIIFEQQIPELAAVTLGLQAQPAAAPEDSAVASGEPADTPSALRAPLDAEPCCDLTVTADLVDGAEVDSARAIVPMCGNPTQSSSDAARGTEDSKISGELAQRSHPMPADPFADSLRDELASATADLAALSAANQSLAAKLAESEEHRTLLRFEFETAQRQWDEERSRFSSGDRRGGHES